MQRVMIIGQPGSGKSTLARDLGKATGLPVYHMDQIHWMPGWTLRPMDEKIRLTQRIHTKESWIFEGGFASFGAERLSRADTLIWLDTGLVRRSFRITLRILKGYGRTRFDLPENCPERFDAFFLRWVWDTRHTARAKMQSLYDSTDKPKHRFTSFAQSNAYLKSFAS